MLRIFRYQNTSKSNVMKRILTLYLIFSIHFSFAQFKTGFNPQEVKDMIQICNSFTYIDLYGSDEAIIPSGYTKTYTSPVLGMDNCFQVYTKGKLGVINFRGSTDKKQSWMENVHSAILPAIGKIEIKDKTFHYQFAKDTIAGVHAGYALGLAYLHEELLTQIKKLNKRGIHHIILTGHSQGGSLAILTRTYLGYLSHHKLNKKNQFKVIVFAQPMVGNIEFVKEYNYKYSDKELSFSLINKADLVPKMPISYNDTTFWRSHLGKLLSKEEKFDKSAMFKEGMTLLFQKKILGINEKFGKSVEKQIEKELGEITLPNPKKEINYSQVGNLIILPSPQYPLEMKDSTLLNDEAFLATHPRDENGVFLDKSVYKKTTMSQNHKPYNYYTAVLQVYFPEEYEKIEPKLFGL